MCECCSETFKLERTCGNDHALRKVAASPHIEDDDVPPMGIRHHLRNLHAERCCQGQLIAILPSVTGIISHLQ